MVATTTPMRHPGSEPVTDADFVGSLGAQRKAAGMAQQVLGDRATIHVTQVCSFEAGTSEPTLDVRRALALNSSADSLLLYDDDRSPATPGLRLRLEALDRLGPDEQARVTALIEGAFLRRDARRHLTGQAS